MAEREVMSVEPGTAERSREGPEQTRPSPAPQSWPAGATASHPLLRLQRSAGNAAVASLLAQRRLGRSVDQPPQTVDTKPPDRSADGHTEAEHLQLLVAPSRTVTPPPAPPVDQPEEQLSTTRLGLGPMAGTDGESSTLTELGGSGVEQAVEPTLVHRHEPNEPDPPSESHGAGVLDVQRFGIADLPGAGLVRGGVALVTGAASAVGDLAGAALGAVKALGSGWGPLGTTAGMALSGVGNAARSGIEAVGRVGSSISTSIGQGFTRATGMMGALTRGFTRTMDFGLDTVKGAAGVLGRSLSTMNADGLRSAYAAVKGTLGRVLGGLRAAGSQLAVRGQALWEGLSGQFSGAIARLGAFASGVVNRLQTSAAGALARVAGQWDRLRGTAANLDGIGGVLARTAGGVIDRLLSGLRSLWNGIASAWTSVQRSLSTVAGRVSAQLSAVRESFERRARSMFDRIQGSWRAVTDRATTLARTGVGKVGGFVGRLSGFSLDKTVTQISAISKFLSWVSSARQSAEAALDGRAAQIAGMIEARMPGAAREQVLQHAPGSAGASATSAAPPGSGPGPFLQRLESGPIRNRSSLAVGTTLSRIWEATSQKWSKLSVKQVVIDMLKTMLWPWPAVGHEFVALWADWKSAAARLFVPRSSSIGTFLQDLWTDLLTLYDFPFAAVRHLVNMVGALMGWVTIILVGAGAVVIGALGSLLGPGGTAAGAIAGAGAGLAVAGAAGEAVLAAFVLTQVTQLVKLLVGLASSNLTAEQQSEDVEHASESAIGLAVAAIIAALAWIAGELAGAFLELVRKLRTKAPEQPPPPGPPPELKPPVEDPNAAPPKTAENATPEQKPSGDQGAPLIDASAKVVERSDGTFRLNRKNFSHPEKIVGEPESRVLADANREAVAAELAADKAHIKKVYIGEAADELINGTRGEELSADVVAVTKKSQYYVYEAKGSDIAHGLEQLEHTSRQLGSGRVQRQTIVTKEKITTPGYTVENGVLMSGGKPTLIDGKPVYIKFTTQGKK